MNLRAIILTLIVIWPQHPANASEWVVDKASSTLSFEAFQTGKAFTGVFSDFSAKVTFDPAHPQNGSISATINLASVDAADKQRNSALPSAEWFAITAFPTATFTSKSITALPDGLFAAEGTFGLKGMKKPITLIFSFKETVAGAHVEAHTTLNRSDFNVGSGVWAAGKWVSLNVDVNIVINATKK